MDGTNKWYWLTDLQSTFEISRASTGFRITLPTMFFETDIFSDKLFYWGYERKTGYPVMAQHISLIKENEDYVVVSNNDYELPEGGERDRRVTIAKRFFPESEREESVPETAQIDPVKESIRYFVATPEMKKKGLCYMLSIEEITNLYQKGIRFSPPEEVLGEGLKESSFELEITGIDDLPDADERQTIESLILSRIEDRVSEIERDILAEILRTSEKRSGTQGQPRKPAIENYHEQIRKSNHVQEFVGWIDPNRPNEKDGYSIYHEYIEEGLQVEFIHPSHVVGEICDTEEYLGEAAGHQSTGRVDYFEYDGHLPITLTVYDDRAVSLLEREVSRVYHYFENTTKEGVEQGHRLIEQFKSYSDLWNPQERKEL